jgi:hypothetical protein
MEEFECIQDNMTHEQLMFGKYGEKINIVLRTYNDLREEDVLFLTEFYKKDIREIIQQRLYRRQDELIQMYYQEHEIVCRIFHIHHVYKYVWEEEFYTIYSMRNIPEDEYYKGEEILHDDIDMFHSVMCHRILCILLDFETKYGYHNIVHIKTPIVNQYIRRAFYKRAYDELLKNEILYSQSSESEKNHVSYY